MTPSTGLKQGTTVKVTAGGLPAGLDVGIVQCDQIYGTSFGGILSDCPALTYATTSAAGTLSVQVRVVERTEGEVRLELKSPVDARVFGGALTLVVRVPPGWQEAEVTQGARKMVVPAVRGEVRFDAVPGAEAIRLVGRLQR